MKYLLFFLLISCAKTSYLWNQGTGQLALEWNGRDNEEILNDPKVSLDIKKKIKVVQKSKKYFFNYFDLPVTGIYDETTILKDKAVTYLVIVSPLNKIKAQRFSFPFVGSFPYIGFFDKKDAAAFAREKKKEGFSTFTRPVYAYSTLNKWIFNDNILSSFFIMNEENLIRLIFHELVHTVLFVGDEVSFNENLANFISDELYTIYSNTSGQEREEKAEKKKRNRLLNNEIVKLAKELDQEYKNSKDFKTTLDEFLEERFIPKINNFCQKMGLKEKKKCWPLNSKWNNARFAAFNTYQEKQNMLKEYYIKRGSNLKSFFAFLIEKEKTYQGNKSFLDHLKD